MFPQTPWGRLRALRPIVLSERGLGLAEVIVATVLATVAVLGLAYSFGTGRGLINRFEVARAAVAVAQSRLEVLSAIRDPNDLALAIPVNADSTTYTAPFVYQGSNVGTESWTIAWYHDPADPQPGHHTLKRVTEHVTWYAAGAGDAVDLARLLPRP